MRHPEQLQKVFENGKVKTAELHIINMSPDIQGKEFAFMEGNECLAIASVPMQKWGEVYRFCEALKEGTVFPVLNLPFYEAESVTNPAKQQENHQEIAPRQADRETLMTKISEVSFALNDLTLYLDTHCEDSQAIQLFAECAALRADLLKIFSERFYPLTQACLANCSCEKECESVNGMAFSWECGPAPWEGACV